MKEWLFGLNRIYLATVTAIQLLCAALWLTFRLLSGEKVSFLCLFIALVVIAAVGAFVFGKRKLWVVSVLFVFTMPQVFHTAATGNIALLPDAPRGSIIKLSVQRFSWPNLYKMGYTYFIEGVDQDNVLNLTTSPEKLWDEFFPGIEAFYGDYSTEIYKVFVKTSMQSFKGEIVCDILWDFMDHFFAPFTTELNLAGIRSGSYSGDNYRDFTAGSRKIGSFYIHFGFASFVGLLILGILSAIARVRKPNIHGMLMCLEGMALISVYDIFFPLRGFDYKNAAWIMIIAGFYILYAMRDVNADG